MPAKSTLLTPPGIKCILKKKAYICTGYIILRPFVWRQMVSILAMDCDSLKLITSKLRGRSSSSWPQLACNTKNALCTQLTHFEGFSNKINKNRHLFVAAMRLVLNKIHYSLMILIINNIH